MATHRIAPLVTLCVALAACADGAPRRDLTAPDASAPMALAAFDESDEVIALAPDGELTGARAPRGPSRPAMPPRAANVGGAVAHVRLSMGAMAQEYSLQARTANPFPAGKGQLTGTITSVGYRLEIEADLDCITTDGNGAWVSGPIRRFVSNGVERTVTFHILVRIAEATADSPEVASALYGTRPGWCNVRPALALLPNEGGSMQVR